MLFGLVALLAVAAFFVMRSRREREEADLAPEDRLSDEKFREIEFGDDE